MRRSDRDRDQARAEILCDLVSDEREAAGLSRDGLRKIIPRHIWAVAAIKDDTFFDPSWKQAPVVVDFLSSKIATWRSNPYKRGCETAYSDIYVSQLSTHETVQMTIVTVDPPGRKPGRETAKNLMWEIAEEILNDPAQCPIIRHSWRAELARMIKTRLQAQVISYKENTIEGYIRPSLEQWEKTNLPKS